MLHVYGAEASFHDENKDARIFGYHDGGRHILDPDGGKIVLIGTKSFINDVILAAQSFVDRLKVDEELRERVASRLPGLLRTIRIEASKDWSPYILHRVKGKFKLSHLPL